MKLPRNKTVFWSLGIVVALTVLVAVFFNDGIAKIFKGRSVAAVDTLRVLAPGFTHDARIDDAQYDPSNLIWHMTGSGRDTLWTLFRIGNLRRLEDVQIMAARYESRSSHVYEARIFSLPDSVIRKTQPDTVNFVRDTFRRGRLNLVVRAVFMVNGGKPGKIEVLSPQRLNLGAEYLGGLYGMMITRDRSDRNDTASGSAFRGVGLVLRREGPVPIPPIKDKK